MIDPRTIRRDSALTLTAMVIGAAVFGGAQWAVGVGAGGALIFVNLLLVSRLVARVAAEVASPAELAIGLLAKSTLSLVGLYFLVKHLHAPAVMVGLVSVVSAIGFRSVAQAFAAPVAPPADASAATPAAAPAATPALAQEA